MLYTARTLSVPGGRADSASYSILQRMSLAYGNATVGWGREGGGGEGKRRKVGVRIKGGRAAERAVE